MSSDKQHLSIEQIEHLIDRARGVEPSGEPDLSEQARVHLAQCKSCQRWLTEQEESDRGLRALRADPSAKATRKCVGEDVLCALAGGLLEGQEFESVMKHVLECDRCSGLLNQVTTVLEGQRTPEEETLLAQLETSQPGWPEVFARRLVRGGADSRVRETAVLGKPARNWPFLRVRWLLVGATTAVLLMIGAGVIMLRSPAYAEHLLAQAYSERRTLELRIPGATQAPMRAQRSGDDSQLSRPRALLEAEALIAGKLTSRSADPDWLGAKGRAELLEGNYKEAIHTLQHALDLKPGSPAMLSDLAACYFLRAESEDRPIDYGSAVDLLGRALAKSPDDPVLLFNRAIVAERAFLFTQAVEDWEHYLRVAPRGRWATEAKSRLKELNEKLQSHDQISSLPLWSIERIGGSSRLDHATEAELEAGIEEYLRAATSEWLVEAFPSDSQDFHAESVSFARTSLRKLASVAKNVHTDAWLEDLLQRSSSPKFQVAVSVFARALRASESGNFSATREDATQAAQLFHDAGNAAGEVRAKFEKIYALQLSNKSSDCLKEAGGLRTNPSLKRYSWLNAQITLERAICLNMAGDLQQARSLAAQASALARGGGYRSLDLRAISMASPFEADVGNHSSAWQLAHSGLTRFWSERSSAMRGYNLYADLDELAEASRQPYLQVAIWKQATGMIATNRDVLLRAMAQLRLAHVAAEVQMIPVAQRAYLDGTRLLESLPQDEATENNEMEASIWFARFQMGTGDWDAAFRSLSDKVTTVQKMSTRYVSVDFYQTLAELYRRRGQFSEGERVLTAAIAPAERALASLSTEEDRLRWNHETSAAYRLLVRLKLDKGETLRALELWEWYLGAPLRRVAHNMEENPSGQASGGLVALPAPNEVARKQPEILSQSIISYAVFSDGLAIWVYDNRGVQYQWVALDAADLKHTVNRFVELCSDPDSDRTSLERYGRKLYGLLITPIEGSLATDRVLLIEPDVEMAEVPMQALIDRNGRYFGEKHSIVSSPGLYQAGQLRAELQVDRNLQTLVVADPAQDDENSPAPVLRDAVDEGAAVAEFFSRSQVLGGRRATWSNIRGEMPRSDVFHFAGHAIANETEAGLLLAKDPALPESPAILDGRSLNATWAQNIRLAVLSACLTQRGIEGWSFDPDSLAMLFLNAGVPQVVASRWRVDSHVTAILMEEFYRELLQGASVARSLKLGEEEIRRRPETSHPYYWAAFSVFGKA